MVGIFFCYLKKKKGKPQKNNNNFTLFSYENNAFYDYDQILETVVQTASWAV